MLVLSRKLNESIVIDDNIVVTIVEIRGGKTRLGIQAPKETSIHRKEVHDTGRFTRSYKRDDEIEIKNYENQFKGYLESENYGSALETIENANKAEIDLNKLNITRNEIDRAYYGSNKPEYNI